MMRGVGPALQDAWHPTEAGAGYSLPKSLEKFRRQMNVFTDVLA